MCLEDIKMGRRMESVPFRIISSDTPALMREANPKRVRIIFTNEAGSDLVVWFGIPAVTARGFIFPASKSPHILKIEEWGLLLTGQINASDATSPGGNISGWDVELPATLDAIGGLSE